MSDLRNMKRTFSFVEGWTAEDEQARIGWDWHLEDSKPVPADSGP
jgi:hypothetical protein